MKLSEIIRESGISPEDFPKASEKTVTLYDSKNREITDQTLKLAKPMFHDNPQSKENFKRLLEKLEKSDLQSFNVFFDQGFLGFFYKTPKFQLFRRGRPVDPFEYLE